MFINVIFQIPCIKASLFLRRENKRNIALTKGIGHSQKFNITVRLSAEPGRLYLIFRAYYYFTNVSVLCTFTIL